MKIKAGIAHNARDCTKMKVMKRRSSRVFSTTKGEGFLMGIECLGDEIERLYVEIGTRKKYNGRGTWPE